MNKYFVTNTGYCVWRLNEKKELTVATPIHSWEPSACNPNMFSGELHSSLKRISRKDARKRLPNAFKKA
jgi:hypothetical protein